MRSPLADLARLGRDLAGIVLNQLARQKEYGVEVAAGGPWQPQSLRRTSSVVSRAAAIFDWLCAPSVRMVYFTSRDSYPCSRVILLTKRDKPLSLNASRDSYPY